MERKVFEDQLYALEERFKAWDSDMRTLLKDALGDKKEIFLTALAEQDNLPEVTIYESWADATQNIEIERIILDESDIFYFEDYDRNIWNEEVLTGCQGIYPLLAAVRDELKAREGIKI